MTAEFIVPASFRAMPRWWHDGQDWLNGLPALVADLLEEWDLDPDGLPRHGSNALVLPVHRGEARYALRLTPADADSLTGMRRSMGNLPVRRMRFRTGWGLDYGLTEDPLRCERLGAALLV